MKNYAILLLFFLTALISCNKDLENSSGHPMPGLYGISEEQKKLHDLFKDIITDRDTFGISGSLDSFLIDSIYCQPNNKMTDCNYALIKAFETSLELNVGDKIALKNGEMKLIDEPFFEKNYIDFLLLLGSPEDFKYLEFGTLKDGKVRGCCTYSKVISIDTATKVIEFTFPNSEYGFRLKSID